jgi:hypothetical protein
MFTPFFQRSFRLCGLAFLLAFSPYGLTAAIDTPPDVSVDKKTWINALNTQLPPRLCAAQHYFTQCFEVTEATCVSTITPIIEACLHNVTPQLPERITPKEAGYWGTLVGRCSLDLYEKQLASKKRDIPECRSPAAEDKNNPPAPAKPK